MAQMVILGEGMDWYKNARSFRYPILYSRAFIWKRVFVSIIAGDIRFTSGQHMSSSAIALTAGTSGSDTTTEFLHKQ